jgi:Zn finger protein HypA/HybF involved in hydrogenase expression
MSTLEVADIFRDHGARWRQANAGHISLRKLKAMSAIENCRTATLGALVLRCPQCDVTEISYNSCRNRHCPKCQSAAANRWLEARQRELLPVEYFHIVFTVPASIADIAFQNPAVVYNILFKAASQTLLTIAADPKHLGVRAGLTAVLHTWGSAMSHHPHLHCIVPGGGLSTDGQHWAHCRKGFFLPVRVLSRLFRRLFIEQLQKAFDQKRLQFHASLSSLEDGQAFKQFLMPARQCEWVVYAKRPFSGPEAVLKYLSLYTHRVAISNSRLIEADKQNVKFKWKDYRLKKKARYRTMTLGTDEFIRRFLIHILPDKLHRIRHYGFLSNAVRAEKLETIRKLLSVTIENNDKEDNTQDHSFQCRQCGSPLLVIEIIKNRFAQVRAPPKPHSLLA